MEVLSSVSGYDFPYYLSDNDGYVKSNNIKGLALLKFKTKLKIQFKLVEKRLQETLKKGYCYYGPFKGEFGHFTAHTLPFLMYLHKHKVKIIYCGLELHKPFMIDELGNSIIHEFIPLRDFFAEVSPSSNNTIPPEDVQKEIKAFEKKATSSEYPFWNIGDDFYYWFIHRNWLLENHTHVYNIGKYYAGKKENTCCVFPRSKGAAKSHNNGERWDYEDLILKLTPYFDRVYVCGHPAQVKDLNLDHPKVEIAVSADNTLMLQKTSKSNLIITQHSGVNNVGEYVNTQVLIIYKGGKSVSDIGSMNNTLKFRKALGDKLPLAFAFNEEEIISFVKNYTD